MLSQENSVLLKDFSSWSRKLQQLNVRTHAIPISHGLFWWTEKRQKETWASAGCIERVDVVKIGLVQPSGHSGFKLATNRNSAPHRGCQAAFTRLCVHTVDVFSWWCPGGLFVGGLFCFQSAHFLTCFPLPWLVHLP